MNAVEIEQAITDLAELPFEAASFPFAFLEAFGNKETTLKRLRAGASNKSDVGGVLQTNNIHILTCDAGQVTKTLGVLKASPATTKAKARFILATDGTDFEAEDLTSGETVAILAKTMSEESLKQVQAAISAKRTILTPEEAKELAVRAVQFKRERGRVPALDAQDAWERRMAEGAATFLRFKKEGRYE